MCHSAWRTHELDLAGGRGVLTVRTAAEAGSVGRTKNEMGKGQGKTKQNLEDLKRRRQLNVARVCGAGDGRPRAGSWMKDHKWPQIHL